jgi:porin
MVGIVGRLLRRLGRKAAGLAVAMGLVVAHPAAGQDTPATAGHDVATEETQTTPAPDGPNAGSHFDDDDIEVPERTFYESALMLPPAHLLGDWLGWRTRMEQSGLTPKVMWVTNLAGNPTGGRAQGFTETENLGIDLTYDLSHMAGIHDGKFHISMSERTGSSLSDEYIGNVFTVQQVYGGQTARLVHAEYERSFLDGDIEFSIGRIAAGDDFLVSPYYTFFMQNGICGNPKGIFFNSPGMTAYPNTTWGTRVQAYTTSRTYAMFGIYNGDSTIRANENHGCDMSMRGPAFFISEVGYIHNGQPNDEGLLGHYKAGFYYDGSQFTRYSLASVLPLATTDMATSVVGNWGYYLLGDQGLIKFGDKQSKRGLGVFGTVVVAPDETTNTMPFFCNGGIIARGLFASRPTDTLGFAVVYGRFSYELRAAQQLAQRFDSSINVQTDELVYEWGYRFRLRDGAAFFQPDLQYIVNPGAASQYANAFVIGAQAGINF